MAGLRVVLSGTLSAIPGFESLAKGALLNQGDGMGSCILVGEMGDVVQAMACYMWQVGEVENWGWFVSGEPISSLVVEVELETATISPFLSAGDPRKKGAEAVKEDWG